MLRLRVRVIAVSAITLSFFFLTGCGGVSTPASQGMASYMLTVTAPSAWGAVTSSPTGIRCPGTCAASFAQNTKITLTATPGNSYFFGGWSGACSGVSSCTLTLNAPVSVSAAFTAGEKLTVTMAGAGSGIVTSTPSGIYCPTICSASFPPNTQVSLTQSVGNGDAFTGWSGACSGTATCSLTLSGADSVTATFAAASSGGGSGSNIVAYVFTVDNYAMSSSEFALLASGQLQPTTVSVPYGLPTGTAHGIVYGGPRQSTSVQSYALEADGSLTPQGAAVTFPADKSWSFASDNNNYFYVASDEGIYTYLSQTGGLTLLASNPLSAPVSCTPAQEDANDCQFVGSLTVSGSIAILSEWATLVGHPNPPQLRTFTRSNGKLTPGPLIPTSDPIQDPMAAAPNGQFVYFIDQYNRILLYNLSSGVYSTQATGAEGDALWTVLMSPDGSFLYVPETRAQAATAVRVFRVESSTGNLSEVAGSPFSMGEGSVMDSSLDVTLDPTGQFLLGTFGVCAPTCIPPGKLVAMGINQTTGALAVTSDVVDGINPGQVTAAVISQ